MRNSWLPGFIVLTMFVVFACSKPRRPDGVLSRRQMVEVMLQIYIAEEKVNRLNVKSDSSRKVFEVMKGRVFDSASVSDSVFRRSFNYYMDHPDQMEKIYTALVDSLNLKEQRSSFGPSE